MTTFIISFVISIVAILVAGHIIENGDMNATGMYLIVFSIPSLLLTALNSLFIRFSLKNLNRNGQKIRLIMFPIILTGMLSLGGTQFDSGQFGFTTSVAFISISIVNAYWIVKLKSSK